MLEDYYVKPSTIDRIRSRWLAPQIRLSTLSAFHGDSWRITGNPSVIR